MAADEDAALTETSSANDVRTAVVIVHGMGEQHPMSTLDGFVKTALRPRSVNGDQRWDYYYSRPAEITGSYEARRYIARHLGSFTAPGGEPTEPFQGDTEIYEYHWSFLMTGNRFADVMPTTLRLFLRRPSNVPDPLFGIWRAVWIVVSAILLSVPALFVVGYLLDTDVPHWIVGLIGSAVILLFWFGLFRILGKLLVNRVTTSFVDVARYLDTSPHSYAARRAIRGGLVDLLHALHDGRYARIVVVAHSLGAYRIRRADVIVGADPRAARWATDRRAGARPDPAQLLVSTRTGSRPAHRRARRRRHAGRLSATAVHTLARLASTWKPMAHNGFRHRRDADGPRGPAVDPAQTLQRIQEVRPHTPK